MLNNIIINIEPVEINWPPIFPIFLPKNPVVIELKIGNSINERYICITFLILIYIIITIKVYFK